MARMTFSAAQLDRISGSLLGGACGDALGVPYEFKQPPLRADQEPQMIGGGLGPYEPGEWSDDTQMALCIATVTATGGDLTSEDGLDRVAGNYLDWVSNGASDVGIQTRQVLGASGPSAASMREAAENIHRKTGRSAGNGSLMRTAPVALPYLTDPTHLAAAARAVSGLTHYDQLAADACILWCFGIRRAILDGTYDGVREGLAHIPGLRKGKWETWLLEAETQRPSTFVPNGFVVRALQAAWSCIAQSDGLEEALFTAVRIGDDTDTIAAITGALAGARHGASELRPEWRDMVNGWPGMRASDLADLAVRSAK